MPAPQPRVYAHFTSPDLLARWWGPHGFTIPRLDFEPRVGRSYRIEMQPPEGDSFHLAGEFREVDPPDRLSFTFNWDPPDTEDVETVAQLSFRDGQVTLIQEPFATEARVELHRGGWTDSFDKLEELLSA
jgi:uncharacterized protein YndB with AHSA1/START domain